MKILIVYPNLPMMMTPALSVGLFTSICKKNGVDVDLFETTAYTDDIDTGMRLKTKLGNGRMFKPEDLSVMVKPTNQIVPDFRKKVLLFNPDLLLFSVVEDTLKDTKMLLDSISDLDIDHVIGGVWPINAPEKCLEENSINTICRFEGELVLEDIIIAYQNGDDWKDTKGLWYKKDGKIIRNGNQPLVDLNRVMPDYSLYPSERFNRPMGGRIVKSVGVETYRGCPYQCTFCNSPMQRHLDKNYLRRKSIDVVKAELTNYVKLYNPNFWFIIDDSFVARPRNELFELLRVIKGFNIPWWCNTRLENVDPDILDAMAEAHCSRITFGIESGDEEYRRKYLLRNVSDELYLSKADDLNQSGIPYSLNIVIGFPDETKEMVMKGAKLIKQIGGNDSLAVSIFIPYHGTILRNIAIEKGYLDQDWISGNGYLVDGSPLRMPKPYLQKDEIQDLANKFKYYTFFDESHWDVIDRMKDTSQYETIYNEYMPKLAVGGKDHLRLKQKNIWACSAPRDMDIRNVAV